MDYNIILNFIFFSLLVAINAMPHDPTRKELKVPFSWEGNH